MDPPNILVIQEPAICDLVLTYNAKLLIPETGKSKFLSPYLILEKALSLSIGRYISMIPGSVESE